MNPDRFDALSKTFASRVSRRSALTRGGLGLGAAMMAFTGLRSRGDAAPDAQLNTSNWYSVIRRYQLTGSASSTEQALRTGLLPQLSQAQGFVEYFVVESPTNVLTTVSVFTSQANYEATQQSTATWVDQNLPDLPEPDQNTLGDVKVFGASCAQICPPPPVTPTATMAPATPTAAPASPTATPCTGIGCPCNGGVEGECGEGLVCCQSQMNGGSKPGGAGMCAAADACGGTATIPPTAPPTIPPTAPPATPAT